MDTTQKQKFAAITVNLDEISKAIQVLNDNDVDSALYNLASERVFSNLIVFANHNPKIDSPSDFLRGVFYAFQTLNQLPDMLLKIQKENNS